MTATTPLGDLDRSLDALVRVLQAFSEGAFDTDAASETDARTEFEGWSRHAANGGPIPGEDRPRSRRQWRRLELAFAAHRAAEREHVERLRGVVGQLVQGLCQAFREDQQADAHSASELSHLHEVSACTTSIDELREAVVTTVERVQSTLAERERRHQTQLAQLGTRLIAMKLELLEARREAEVDGLTQLYNRAAFDQHLEKAANLAQVMGEKLSILLVDIDHFKRVNDTYGHPGGDAVLRAVADTLVRVASRKTDFVARYGGEELAIVLGDTDAAGADKVATRALASIRSLEVEHGGRPIEVTASIGVATLGPRESVESCLARADAALYDAKQGGRNQSCRRD
ncbi:MAG: GGDEF domain-containing protein [Myxococcota bacterium]